MKPISNPKSSKEDNTSNNILDGKPVTDRVCKIWDFEEKNFDKVTTKKWSEEYALKVSDEEFFMSSKMVAIHYYLKAVKECQVEELVKLAKWTLEVTKTSMDPSATDLSLRIKDVLSKLEDK